MTSKKRPKAKRERNKGGRPTAYRPQFCKEMIAYFDVEPYREREIVIVHKDGREETRYETVPNDLPTFAGFARKIGSHRESILNWCKEHPEFFDAYKKAKEIQDDILSTNAMRSLYASTFSIFFAKNALDDRYKDRVEQDTKLSGDLNVGFSLIDLHKKADERG